MLRRILILAVAALVAVMMTAAPAVATEHAVEQSEKCLDAQQELAQANEEKEKEKATRKVAEKCAPPPP